MNSTYGMIWTAPDECWCICTRRVTYHVSDLVHDMVREELKLNNEKPQHIIEFEDLSGGRVELTVGTILEMFYTTPETRQRDRALWQKYRSERLADGEIGGPE